MRHAPVGVFLPGNELSPFGIEPPKRASTRAFRLERSAEGTEEVRYEIRRSARGTAVDRTHNRFCTGLAERSNETTNNSRMLDHHHTATGSERAMAPNTC